MNRVIIVLFFIWGYCSFTSAQSSPLKELIEHDLKIAQKEGTNELLREYLSDIDSRSDTLYAILFRPMNCPRCEATIPYFENTFKKMYPHAETLLISAYEDKEAAKQYLARNTYVANHYLFDSTHDYDKIFSFNCNGLQGLYILKLDKKNGRLIIGGSPITQDRQLVRELYEFRDAFPYHTFEQEQEQEKNTAQAAYAGVPLKYDKYSLNSVSGYPVSTVYGTPLMWDGRFIYSDELAGVGYDFKINKRERSIDFVEIIEADSLEKDRYVDIPLNEYLRCKRNRSIFYIACGINRIGKDKIGMSYSLPRLFMESPNAMAYYNQPAIVIKNAVSLKKEPMMEFDFDLFNEAFMYLHFSFFSLDDDRIVFPCTKATWPIEFEPEEYKGNAERDPFMDEFYDTDCPYLAVFDVKTGKVQQRFGQLDISQRLSRTGYFYSNPLVACEGGNMVYGDGFVGKLFLASINEPSQPQKEYTVFQIDLQKLPPLDTLNFYKLEHAKPYYPVFNRCIESVILSQDKVHCIVREGLPYEQNLQSDLYEYVSIDRESGDVVERFRLEREKDDENARILYIGIGRDGDEVTPYYFAKKEEQVYIKFIYPDK